MTCGSFRKLSDSASASVVLGTLLSRQCRVAIWEDSATGGLQIEQRARSLRQWLESTDYIGRSLVRFRHWFENAHVFTLERALQSLRTLGHSPVTLLDTLAPSSRPWTRPVFLKAKRSTQAKIHDLLLASDSSYGPTRTLHKIRRWRFPGDQEQVVQRILPRLRNLQRHVPPRVQTAVFNTLWNRWVTARRFQRGGQAGDRCLLCCGTPEASDSIEHYLTCPTLLAFARTRMGVHLQPASSASHLFLAAFPPNPRRAGQWWAKCALLVYAAYRTTNSARHLPPFSPGEARRALNQALYEGSRNHLVATRLADNLIAH